MRALERGATLGIQAARAAQDRWWKVPAAAPSAAAKAEDVSAIEVRDLRAELARELERLAGADIRASRGSGKLADEAPPADA